MKLVERSYSSRIIRPRPLIRTEPDGSLLIITTSWGEAEHAHLVNEEVTKYVQAALADVEVTSPFEFLTCLSDEANYLRVAMMICNERLYRADNKSEFTAGVEVLVLLRKGSQIAYAQVGSPHLLVQRPGQGLAPVSVQYEASLELGVPNEVLPPLPQVLLGTDSSLNIRSGDFHFEESGQLIVYAGDFWPGILWQDPFGAQSLDLQYITNKIVQKKPDAPFWLGLVDLST